jgi:hypothetical protein
MELYANYIPCLIASSKTAKKIFNGIHFAGYTYLSDELL